MKDKILEIVKTVRDRETFPTWALMMKLGEEVGELNESLLAEFGYLKHKDKEFESPFGEAADVILVVLNVLTTQYKDELTAEEIVAELEKQIHKKFEKYLKRLECDVNNTKYT